MPTVTVYTRLRTADNEDACLETELENVTKIEYSERTQYVTFSDKLDRPLCVIDRNDLACWLADYDDDDEDIEKITVIGET